MQMVAAGRWQDKHKDESDVVFFADATKSVVTILWELDEREKNRDAFWSAYVVGYFRAAGDAGHLQAMAYDARRSLRNEEITRWINEHAPEIEGYRAWHGAWKPGPG